MIEELGIVNMTVAEKLAGVARFAVSSVGESLLTRIVPKAVPSSLAASEVKDVLPLVVLTVGSHTGKPMTCQMIPGRNDSLTISPARAGSYPSHSGIGRGSPCTSIRPVTTPDGCIHRDTFMTGCPPPTLISKMPGSSTRRPA